MNRLEAFNNLSLLFQAHGYKLFLVGGSVRDYLLKKEIIDLDVTSDATPSEIRAFIGDDADYTFSKYGNVNIDFVGYKFELTTLRKEDKYFDSRHPNKITFTKDLKEDSNRRDFTINALYMDMNKNIYDYHQGLNDLQTGVLKMIGEPTKRIMEDPLRILRAIRFSYLLSFKIDESLKISMHQNVELLKKLNPEKIKQELRKFNAEKEKIFPLFDEFGITNLLDMLN